MDLPPSKCMTRIWDIERKQILQKYKTFGMAFLDALPHFQVEHTGIPPPEQHWQHSACITAQAIAPEQRWQYLRSCANGNPSPAEALALPPLPGAAMQLPT